MSWTAIVVCMNCFDKQSFPTEQPFSDDPIWNAKIQQDWDESLTLVGTKTTISCKKCDQISTALRRTVPTGCLSVAQDELL
jgi:hypothetical protein